MELSPPVVYYIFVSFVAVDGEDGFTGCFGGIEMELYIWFYLERLLRRRRRTLHVWRNVGVVNNELPTLLDQETI
jgi:hypothetical protein